MSPLTERRSRTYPELAVLVGLRAQLELLAPVMAGVHGQTGGTALRDQGRSMVRIARALVHQIDAYEAVINTLPPTCDR